MDPQATFMLWTVARKLGDVADAYDHAKALVAWLANGGFAPTCTVDAIRVFADYCRAVGLHGSADRYWYTEGKGQS